MIHSIKVFEHVNIASCSCETGEGMISTLSSLFKNTNNTVDKCLDKVLLQIVSQEEYWINEVFERNSSRNDPKGVVFTDDFVKQYKSKKVKVVILSTDWSTFKSFCLSILWLF